MNTSYYPDNKSKALTDSADGECLVLLTYEDDASKEHAQHVIDHLVKALWREVSFDVTWFDLRRLDEDVTDKKATQLALEADIILISLHANSTIGAQTMSWATAWAASRKKNESLLVALIGVEGDEPKGFTPTHVQLRNLASRANMDFLPLVLHTVVDRETRSSEWLIKRATESSPVLDSILRYQPPPPEYGWGIND